MMDVHWALSDSWVLVVHLETQYTIWFELSLSQLGMFMGLPRKKRTFELWFCMQRKVDFPKVSQKIVDHLANQEPLCWRCLMRNPFLFSAPWFEGVFNGQTGWQWPFGVIGYTGCSKLYLFVLSYYNLPF